MPWALSLLVLEELVLMLFQLSFDLSVQLVSLLFQSSDSPHSSWVHHFILLFLKGNFIVDNERAISSSELLGGKMQLFIFLRKLNWLLGILLWFLDFLYFFVSSCSIMRSQFGEMKASLVVRTHLKKMVGSEFYWVIPMPFSRWELFLLLWQWVHLHESHYWIFINHIILFTSQQCSGQQGMDLHRAQSSLMFSSWLDSIN